MIDEQTSPFALLSTTANWKSVKSGSVAAIRYLRDSSTVVPNGTYESSAAVRPLGGVQAA